MAGRRCTGSSQAFVAATAFLMWITLDYANGAIHDLYDTKIATSDLRWTKEPRNSWEEVSGFDRYHNVIRSYQICRPSSRENNSWLRSPFINTKGALRVNVEIEFSIAKCDWPGADADYCRQTFNLFYYESDRDVASSTFPPWQERPYVKIDTVTANSDNVINKKTFTIEPLKSSASGGIYVAAQDQGACMSLIGLRLYYYYCPETTRSLANFAETMTGSKTASLVTVPGTCVSNAEVTEGAEPKYHCGSTGEWQVITGSCKCAVGYYANSDATECLPCVAGTFKPRAGNGKCTRCPANSGARAENASRAPRKDPATALVSISSEGMSACPCRPGYARAKYENLGQPCTKNPSTPTLVAAQANTTTAFISWQEPNDLGGRTDLYYSFSCLECAIDDLDSCEKCPERVRYRARPGSRQDVVSLSSIVKFRKRRIEMVNLEPFTRYVFKIYARNGVSDAVPEAKASYLLIELATEESVPPPVVNIYIADTSPNSVVVNWHAPLRPRGRISGYEVELRQQNGDPSELFSAADGGQIEPRVFETARTACTLDDLASNTEYVVRIRAESSAGFGRYSDSVSFKTSKRNKAMGKSDNDNGPGLLIAAVSAILIVAIVCSSLFLYYIRKRAAARSSKSAAADDEALSKLNPDAVARYNEVARHGAAAQRGRVGARAGGFQTTYVDYPDPRRAVQRMDKEIEPLNLRLHSAIGRGEFAIVYKASMVNDGESKTVAAKQLKDGANAKDRTNFLREACTMAQFDHPNILKLIGVVTKHTPEMIISEHMENGSLHQFLKRYKGQLSMPQLLQMMRGIVGGMRYLSDIKFVHRDLAARNILVGSDLVCKVSDFGLSRALENDPRATYTTRGGKIPLRWTAPESIRFREFTSASDVWSYGIVMWEVMSFGEKPYWNMTNEDVMQSIGSGMRLPAPTGCPKALHELMLECWSLDPTKRPTFSRILSDFNRFIRRSSLLRVRQEDEMERSVCCSPDVRDAIFVDQTGESFLGDPEMASPDADYPESESSSVSQEDTCSSVLAADERCLNV